MATAVVSNRCGGHNDRKRGGYHVHWMAQYCACHPEEPACKTQPTNDTAKPR